MSISVDDLIASLNSNHIGQEAMDIANLHAQLAQALLSQPPASAHPALRRGHNTPLARTPSSNFVWETVEFSRSRSSSVAGATQKRVADERISDLDEMDEDERMVEELLFPSASHFQDQYPPSSSPTRGYSCVVSRRSSIQHLSPSYEYPPSELTPSNTSLFASTDPFYAAQVQAAQNPPTSFFAQAGHPSAHSPFLLAQQLQSAYGHTYSHPEVDPHHMFSPSPAAFTC
ncbi:uncharacterized protein FIBRA_06147 [Fibroporia radiculosa]|uniref:Uncharacterized protein n=1 Tax=Fibroporia radiculosa TaxID=599839 RepID=J4IB39_9APHY|nr:uncharacterized protein FIBRA_06147 [Fibroporia radiculosa]CCM03991.1 predicted protein [Fibroporia radiculosa]